MLFGYIVSETKYRDLEDDIIQVVSNWDECKEGLPRLVVGLDMAKRYASEMGFEFDILEHVYPNGDMWTFKKTEKREFYEEDKETFKKRIISHTCDNVDYYYINIYKLKYSDMKRLHSIIFENGLSREYNPIVIDGGMFYFPLGGNKVMGISFPHLEYIGIHKEKIIDRLKSCKSNKVYFTSGKNMRKLKDWFEGREYVIASLLWRNKT